MTENEIKNLGRAKIKQCYGIEFGEDIERMVNIYYDGFCDAVRQINKNGCIADVKPILYGLRNGDNTWAGEFYINKLDAEKRVENIINTTNPLWVQFGGYIDIVPIS